MMDSFKDTKEYIVSLSDISDREIENNMYIYDFPYYHLILAEKSGYTISEVSNEEEFAAGDVIFVSEGRRFGVRCDGTMRVRHITFSGRRIKPLLHYCRLGEFSVIHTSDEEQNKAIKCFKNVSELNKSDSAAKHAKLSASLYELLAYLGAVNLKDVRYVSGKNDLTSGMEYAKQLLFRFSRRKLDIVAEHMGYENTARFAEDFYKQFHMTPNDFLMLYPRKM